MFSKLLFCEIFIDILNLRAKDAFLDVLLINQCCYLKDNWLFTFFYFFIRFHLQILILRMKGVLPINIKNKDK